MFSPALRQGGTLPTKVRVVAKLSSCTGAGDGEFMTGGKFVGTGTLPTNGCNSFYSSNLPPLRVRVKWKAAPPFRFNPSFRTFAAPPSSIGTEDGMNFTQSGTANTDTGSFFTVPMRISLWADQTVGDFANACQGTRGGRVFTYTGLNPVRSTLTFG